MSKYDLFAPILRDRENLKEYGLGELNPEFRLQILQEQIKGRKEVIGGLEELLEKHDPEFEKVGRDDPKWWITPIWRREGVLPDKRTVEEGKGWVEEKVGGIGRTVQIGAFILIGIVIFIIVKSILR